MLKSQLFVPALEASLHNFSKDLPHTNTYVHSTTRTPPLLFPLADLRPPAMSLVCGAAKSPFETCCCQSYRSLRSDFNLPQLVAASWVASRSAKQLAARSLSGRSAKNVKSCEKLITIDRLTFGDPFPSVIILSLTIYNNFTRQFDWKRRMERVSFLVFKGLIGELF